MPCGGIYTLPEGDEGRKHPCFVCRKSEPECELFCEEWDCTLHIACLGRFLCTGEGEIVINHKHDIHVQLGKESEIPLIPALRLAGQLMPDGGDLLVEVVTLRENLRQINEAKGRVVTCVYCGHVYGPDGTATAKTDMLTKHIAECPLHPLKGFVDLVRRMHDLLTADMTLGMNPTLRKIGLEMETELGKLR